MLQQCAAYEAADKAAADAERAANKEVSEGATALNALKPVFDQTREVLAAKLGITYEAASRFTTPDDLLSAAEDLENQLLGVGGEGWAQTWHGVRPQAQFGSL